MSEQKTRIEELERPAEELTDQTAAEVRGGGGTHAATAGSGQVTADATDPNTRQTRQTSIVVDL